MVMKYVFSYKEFVVKFFYKTLDIRLVNQYTKDGKDKQRCKKNRIKE